MKRIFYTGADGFTWHILPSERKCARLGMTETEYLDFVKRKDVPPDATDVIEVEVSDIPAVSFRHFRAAFKIAGGKLEVDMPKAREIHMGKIREVRNAELEKRDIDYQRADESGDAVRKAAVASEKQKLRDIPQTFDLTVARTPEDLRALWPADLPKA